MNAFLLFLMGTDPMGIIVMLIILAILGCGFFFLCKAIVKKVFKQSPNKINLISFITSSLVLVPIFFYIFYGLYIGIEYSKTLPFFNQPQPEGQAELKVIPEILIGKYTCATIPSSLTVSKTEVILKSIWNRNFQLKELDSMELKNLRDTTYYDGRDSMIVKVKNDSIFQRTISFDTLINSSEKYLLKKANECYFLNEKIGSHWRVQLLRVTKKGVQLSMLLTRDDLKWLKENSFSGSDSIRFSILRKSEKADSINMSGLRREIEFIRIEE